MPTTYPLGKLRVNCLKTLKKLSICLPGKTPSAPSDSEDEEDEAMTSMEVDKGSPVALDSDLDDFGSLELRPTLERCGDMGGWVNWLVQIEEEPLDKVEALVLNGVPPLYDDQVVHRLVPIEDSPPYKDSPRYLSVEL